MELYFLEQLMPLSFDIFDTTPFSMRVRWSNLHYVNEPMSNVRVDSWTASIRLRENDNEESYAEV